MLKRRVIACLLVKNGWLVQSIGFQKYLPVGRAHVAIEFLNRWGIDGIILLDIDASVKGTSIDPEFIDAISRKSFVPFAVGGGITTTEQMRELVHRGADKVVINSAAYDRPELIREGAAIFGNQCIVVAIDARRKNDGTYEVYSHSAQQPRRMSPSQWAKQVQDLGAGEVLINSVDRDGMKTGYDIDLIHEVTNAVDIPVIICGGVGTLQHFVDGARLTSASALAAGNIFHFMEHSPILIKSYLRQHGVEVRLDSYAQYFDIVFDDRLGRILKKPDEVLDKLRFTYQAPEVI